MIYNHPAFADEKFKLPDLTAYLKSYGTRLLFDAITGHQLNLFQSLSFLLKPPLTSICVSNWEQRPTLHNFEQLSYRF